MSKENQHISEEEMQRYLNGEMEAKEQHALETRLENDQLAYEAVEGLAKVKEADMARMLLKMQLSAVKDEQSFSWMKIAAAVTIAMMAGLGIWYFSETQPTSQIAYEEAPVIKKKEQAPSTSEPISSPAETISESITEVNEEVEIEFDKEPIISKNPVLAEVEIIDPPSTQPAEDLSAIRTEVAITLEESRADEDEIQISEEVLEEALEEMVLEEVVFEDQVVQDFEKTSGAVAEPELSRAAPVTKSMARQSFNSNAPQPLDGFNSYQRYLVDSLRYEAVMGTGMVTLRFTINPEGKPINIQVIESLNQAADSEATRLIKDGSNWSGSAGVPTTLSVPIKPD